jgi:hypothetical protein
MFMACSAFQDRPGPRGARLCRKATIAVWDAAIYCTSVVRD